MNESAVSWPHGARCAAAITFDVDGESALLSMDATSQRRLGLASHQAYGPTVGLYRILALLSDLQVPATFFVSGYVARRYPASMRDIVRDGHEIGHHGGVRQSLADRGRLTELQLIREGFDALDQICGVHPIGYRAPGWDMSWSTPELLQQSGFLYDSTLMDSDVPYEIQIDPSDEDRRLVELPISWALDDWSQYCMVPGFYDHGRMESPRRVVETWKEEFDAIRAEGGYFALVNHPFLSGRPARAAALKELLRSMGQAGDVWVAALGDIAHHVRSCQLPPRPLVAPIS